VYVCVCEIWYLFSCGTVGQLFCRIEQQIDKVVKLMSTVKYDDDVSLTKLETVLTDLRHRCLLLHLQQFVQLFVSVLLELDSLCHCVPRVGQPLSLCR